MANQERQAVLEDGRAVPAGERDQGVKSSGVRSYDEGKTGG